MSEYIYVGLDLSFNRLGLAVSSSTGVHYCHFGSSPTFPYRGERYDRLAERVLSELPDDSQAVRVFFEHYIMGGVGRICDMAELAGYIKGRLRERQYDIYEVPPTTLKKFTAGSGRASKSDMIAACLRRYGVAFKDTEDNECDAYCLIEFGKYLFDEAVPFLKRKLWIDSINQF